MEDNQKRKPNLNELEDINANEDKDGDKIKDMEKRLTQVEETLTEFTTCRQRCLNN